MDAIRPHHIHIQVVIIVTCRTPTNYSEIDPIFSLARDALIFIDIPKLYLNEIVQHLVYLNV